MSDVYIGDQDELSPKSKETSERDLRISQMPSAPSESLCAYIILFRTLGMEKDFSILCMQELLRRKEQLGDDFDYEQYIKDKMPTVQVPTSKLEGLRRFIQ